MIIREHRKLPIQENSQASKKGKLPSGKKNHEGKLPSQKGEFPSLEIIKDDNIFYLRTVSKLDLTVGSKEVQDCRY